MAGPLTITSSVAIPDSDLEWTAVRASGPGGQNVNKVSSKVELRFDVQGTRALSAPVKARLAALAGSRMDADGRLLVTSQKTRDQSRNLEDAREKLAALVRSALVPPRPRRPTKPSRAARARRVDDKRKQSEKKQARRRSHDE